MFLLELRDQYLLAMKILAENKLVGAELDSSARDPPPRCDTGTRHTLMTSITVWLLDENRQSNLLWLYGSAGVGKSAVAQTIGEYCKPKGWLGAAIFLSRPGKRDDPTRIIPSLVYQLAVRYPAYKRFVADLITNEPAIFEKTLHSQFYKLIVEPLSQLNREREDPDSAILIILDGLDECHRDGPQQKLIELIGSFAAIAHALQLPFLWIIASRPEWSILSAFKKLGRLGSLWQEELLMHSPEARRDVSNFLRNGFKRIRNRYSDAFPRKTTWPTEAQLLVITSAASGLFIYASTILKFVGDDEVGNPVTQLNVCLEILEGKLSLQHGNPLEPLDALYSGMLCNIHSNALPTTLLILSVFMTLGGSFSAQLLANFLFLDQATFYGSLRRLRSILTVPPPEQAGKLSLEICHTSFEGFLRRVFESGNFPVSSHNISTIICKYCIRWLNIRGTLVRNIGRVGSRTRYLIGEASFLMGYIPLTFEPR